MSTPFQQAPLNDTQLRILDAAITCLKKWGHEKTSLNDIARMAGVTRPTVYSYFGSRDQVISAALVRSAIGFSQRSLEHLSRFRKWEDRYIESFLFALQELPKEPYPGLITQSGTSTIVNQDALINEASWQLLSALFREIFSGLKVSDEDMFEISEITVRLLLSLLITQGPVERSPEQMRGFLKRRLLPMVKAVSEAPSRRPKLARG